MKKRIYICSPLGAPTAKQISANMEKAREYVRIIEDSFADVKGYAPHAWLPEMLDDLDSVDRRLGLDFGIQLLRTCDALFVCGSRISSGMANEITLATDWDIPVYTFGTDPTVVFEAIPNYRGQVLLSSNFNEI